MARYADAIRWIAQNDDTDWLEDDPAIPSVTASLVADVFGKDVSRVVADLRASAFDGIDP